MSTDTLPPAYDSIKEVGGYDQIPNTIKAKLPKLANLPTSVQEKAHTAMLNELSKPETQTKLMQEVAALTDSVAKVDAAFERVKVGLGKVDDNEYKDKDGNLIAKFQPTWIGYQATWTTLLWGSRDVATETQAYINDFVQIIIPEVKSIKTDADLAKFRPDLQEFISRTDPFGKKLNSRETEDAAQKYSQDFTDLRNHLNEFKDSFDDFAVYNELQLNKQITDKQSEILKLQGEISACQTVVAAMGIALGITVFATAAGAVGALAAGGPLGPMIAIGVVIVGIIAAAAELATLIAYVVKVNDYKDDLAQAQADLVTLQAALTELQNTKATLESQKADITDIAGRLDRFSAIWGTVKHDAQLINIGLDTAVTAQGTTNAFQTRVSLMETAYTQLGTALDTYATTVGTPPASATTY